MAFLLEAERVVATDASVPAQPRPAARVASIPVWAWLIAVVLLVIHAVLAWQSRTAGVTHSNDDALYMLLGRELGHLSYRESFRVGTPMHGQYPPAWPALIAMVNFVTGSREAAVFGLTVVLSTLGLLAFFDTARRLLPTAIALAVLGAVALNPFLISFGGRVMSEAAYWFWTSITVWALIRGREDRRFLLLACATAIVAAFTRSIGVTLLGAVGISLALDRHWRILTVYAATAGVLLGGWAIFTAVNHETVPGRSYVADVSAQVNHANAKHGKVVTLALKVGRQVREQVMGTIPAMLPLVRLNGTAVDNVLWLVVTVVLGLMGILALRRPLPALGLYLLFYYGLIAVWPWGPRRFFIPVQPFFLLTMVLGANVILRARWPRFAVATIVLLLGAVVYAAIPQTIRNRELLASCDRSSPWTDGHCYDPDQRSFFAAVTFARDSLPLDARFLVEREAGFAYHSHRVVQHDQLAIGLPDSTFRAYLGEKQLGYVVLTRLTGVEVDELAPKLLANCTYFGLVRRFPPYGRLYEFHAEGLPPDRDACSDLRYYRSSTPPRDWTR